jgi:hypothetical protein
MRSHSAAPLGGTRGQRRFDGDSTSISEMTGLPLYDAALALISLAAATTVIDINSLADKGLALQISAMISRNIDPEVTLMDLRTRVLENRPKLAHEWLQQQEKSVPVLESPGSHHCPHCGGILQKEATA